MSSPLDSVARLLLEQTGNHTPEGYQFVVADELKPEEIQAIADVASENDYDIDMQSEGGQEIMVFVPRALSDEPLAQLDLDRDFQSEYEKHRKKLKDGS